MQLSGPGIWGPPKDPAAAVAILRAAVAAGVNHIDTADFYGPHLTNQIIRQALHPYPANLVIVTKLGAQRPADKSWKPAISPQELTAGVHDNLRNLGLDALDVVNYRAMGAIHGPAEGSIAEQVSTLAGLKRKGLVRHIGLSNVTAAQVAEAQAITDIVCVQNNYNVAHREPGRVSPTCRSSPSAGSRRCSRLPCQPWRSGWEPSPCRSRWPGCCTGRPTSC
jgi:aryl-alcohol dehydrogenase-like predicted oxidoreductase